MKKSIKVAIGRITDKEQVTVLTLGSDLSDRYLAWLKPSSSALGFWSSFPGLWVVSWFARLSWQIPVGLWGSPGEASTAMWSSLNAGWLWGRWHLPPAAPTLKHCRFLLEHYLIISIFSGHNWSPHKRWSLGLSFPKLQNKSAEQDTKTSDRSNVRSAISGK